MASVRMLGSAVCTQAWAPCLLRLTWATANQSRSYACFSYLVWGPILQTHAVFWISQTLVAQPYSSSALPPHPHQRSWLELQGHMLQEGHEVGRAALHLLQALELAVLIF